jgi:hypothetical protein
MTWQHGASGYRTYGCRCEICTADNTERARKERAARYAKRVLVAGVLVAVDAHLSHGSVTTYTNWGCRCRPCGSAHSEYLRCRKLRVTTVATP